MAQADQTVQNDTFPNVRSDINSNLAALFSNSSGNVAPTVTVAHMDWIDTSGADPVWKKRNAANNGWITIGTVKTSALEFSGANTLPAQSGNSGKYLTTDGTTATWAAIPLGASVTVFTASGTWTKPSSGTMVYVEMWGGGAGGERSLSGNGLGGGGGAFRWHLVPMSALSATVAVTVGAGGIGDNGVVDNTNGGNSSFGSISANGGDEDGTGGGWGTYDDFPGLAGASGNTLFVGGGGSLSSASAGSSSVYGGAGGGAGGVSTASAGGTSIYGGNGGAGSRTSTAGDGSIPGGGGGGANNQIAGNGARGEVRVYVW